MKYLILNLMCLAMGALVDERPAANVSMKSFDVVENNNVFAANFESTIVSDFTGLSSGNLYKLSNGQYWEQTEAWIWVWTWFHPKVWIYQEAGGYKMKVENIDHPVWVRRVKGAVETTILSRFTGLAYGNTFQMANGQIWQQSEAWNWNWNWSMPSALVWPTNGGYMMKVQGINHAVKVIRIH